MIGNRLNRMIEQDAKAGNEAMEVAQPTSEPTLRCMEDDAGVDDEAQGLEVDVLVPAMGSNGGEASAFVRVEVSEGDAVADASHVDEMVLVDGGERPSHQYSGSMGAVEAQDGAHAQTTEGAGILGDEEYLQMKLNERRLGEACREVDAVRENLLDSQVREQRLQKEVSTMSSEYNALKEKYSKLLNSHMNAIDTAAKLGQHMNAVGPVSTSGYYKSLSLLDRVLEQSGVS